VLVIDEDLGKSGATTAGRVGFQRLVTEITMGHVGLVLGIEMSRLARSGADWCCAAPSLVMGAAVPLVMRAGRPGGVAVGMVVIGSGCGGAHGLDGGRGYRVWVVGVVSSDSRTAITDPGIASWRSVNPFAPKPVSRCCGRR
jgi:hypothetical protein